MKTAGGRWSPEVKTWQFGDIDDALDALYALYAASRLIGEAIGAAKALCHRPIEERPPLVQDDHFDTGAFERGLEARRARVQRSQGRR